MCDSGIKHIMKPEWILFVGKFGESPKDHGGIKVRKGKNESKRKDNKDV
jgi:hypothetical protein